MIYICPYRNVTYALPRFLIWSKFFCSKSFSSANIFLKSLIRSSRLRGYVLFYIQHVKLFKLLDLFLGEIVNQYTLQDGGTFHFHFEYLVS